MQNTVTIEEMENLLMPGPGSYTLNIISRKSFKFPISPRKNEFLDPFGLKKKQLPGPGAYTSEI